MAAKKKAAEDARQPLDLRGSTKNLVIDHHTVHHGLGRVSIHVQERSSDDRATGGQDIAGITAEELGIKGDLAAGLTEAKMIGFVKGLAGSGVAVSMDEPKAPETASTGAEEEE